MGKAKPPPQPVIAATIPSEIRQTSTMSVLLTHCRRRLGTSKTTPSMGMASSQPRVRERATAALAPVCTVNIEVAPPAPGVTTEGEKLAVAPEGNPVTARETLPPKPPVSPTVTI